MSLNEKNPIQEIIDKSGNGFHSRVVRALRDLKWTVLVSPYYSDNFTDKPREIDIVAEKQFQVTHEIFNTWHGTLKVRLFIECKYIQGETVFWFDTKDKPRAIKRIMDDTTFEHPDRNTTIQQHHYFADEPVAKLFSSDKAREENEAINKAINQCLNALVYHRNRSDLFPSDPRKPQKVLRTVSYPLIVVNNYEKFHSTQMAEESSVEHIRDPFALEVNYAYLDKNKEPRNEYFLLDVVSIGKLQQFIEMLQSTDIAAIKQHLQWNEELKGRT